MRKKAMRKQLSNPGGLERELPPAERHGGKRGPAGTFEQHCAFF